MKRSASENIWLVIKYVLLIGFTILCVYPLVWLFLASFKTNAEWSRSERTFVEHIDRSGYF